MASAEREIYTKLSNTVAVTDLVGDRIFPSEPGQDSIYPQIVYRRTSEETSKTLGSGGTDWVYVEVMILGETDESIDEVAAAVKTALHKQRFGALQGCFMDDASTDGDLDSKNIVQTYKVAV